MVRNGLEKWLIRDAFFKCDKNILPHDVLFRHKEAFSDGISSNKRSWYQIIQEQVNQNMSDEYFTTSIEKYNGYVKPLTKEGLFYHEIFDDLYPNQYHICPYYWMPKWIDGVNDPSARTLNIYDEL